MRDFIDLFSFFFFFFTSPSQNCGGNGNPFLFFPAENIKPCVNYAWDVTVILGIFLLLFSFYSYSS